MEVLTVKKQIQDKKLQKLYIFTGEEIGARNIYINKILQVSGLKHIVVDTVNEIYNTLKSKSLLNTNYCYVIYDDLDLLKNEKVYKNLKENINDNLLILVYNNLDKRTGFYKYFKADIVDFDTNLLSNDLLIKYIKQKSKLNNDNCRFLIDICNGDYNKILLELDKIKNYKIGTQDKSDNDVFDILLDSGAIHIPPQDAIFDLVEAILKRDRKLAYEWLDDCKRIGESPLAILSVLFNNCKQVLQVQTCTSNNIEKSTGLTSWQVKCAKGKANYYSDEELLNLLDVITKIEIAIKTGEINAECALDYLMLALKF